MNNALYTFVRIIAWPVVTVALTPKVINKKNLKIKSKCIVCANHTTNWDPILIGHLITTKNVRFMAKAELINHKAAEKFLLGMGIIPVHRGKSDLKAIKEAMKVLKNDQVLGMFPEGTRSPDGELQPFEPGAAMIAIKTKTPVLPVYIHENGAHFGKRVKVMVGEQMMLNDYVDGTDSASDAVKANEVLMDAVKGLRDELLNG